jgi:hypothetical protein
MKLAFGAILSVSKKTAVCIHRDGITPIVRVFIEHIGTLLDPNGVSRVVKMEDVKVWNVFGNNDMPRCWDALLLVEEVLRAFGPANRVRTPRLKAD